MKILLVGGGISSAITGLLLRKLIPGCSISIWDKARGIGGRMTTSRCLINPSCTADLGAQYLTTTDEFINCNGDIYDELITEGVLEPLKCQIIGMRYVTTGKHFVVPGGTSHLVKTIVAKAQINEIKLSHHVSSINRGELEKWTVETKAGVKEDFDAVVLTMPIPQFFLLEGNFKNELSVDVISRLKSVAFSSRYVLILFFGEVLNESWGAQYLDNDPVFRYVAIDNIKRNQLNELSAVVFHSTVEFGSSHVDDNIPDIEKILFDKAKCLFPTWPEPKTVKCHKWRYSQVINKYTDSTGCLVLSSTPPLIISGDGFVGSTFDNCVKSSKAVCEEVKQILC